MEGERQVSYQEGKDYADSLGIPFLETSAKQKINIEECFKKLTSVILPTAEPKKVGDNTTQIRDTRGQKKQSGGGGCC